MAIMFMVVDFEKEVSVENEDILNYLGYIPEIAGKPDVKGLPLVWDVKFNVDFPIWGKLVRLLEEDISVPYLTVVVQRAWKGVEEGSPEWDVVIAKLTQIILFMNDRFDRTLIPEAVDTHVGQDGDIIYQFNVDLAPMEKDLVDSRRGSFKAIEK